MNQTSNTVSTKRMTNNANDDTVIFPGASGKRITFNNFANTVENVVITDTGLVVTGTLSATDAISTQKDTDAVFRGVAMRNSSTGTSAYTQFAMGDSNSAFNFTITSFGTNFTGLGHYVRIQNQYNAPLQLGGYGDIQLSLTNAGAAVTGTLSATSTVTGMGEIRAYRSENASYYSNLVTNYSDVTTTQITTLGAVKFQAGATDNTNLYSSSAKDIVFFPAATERGRFTSTGLAVTGTLSASGLISAPGMITVNATNASFSGAAIKIKTSDNANTTAITAAGTGLYFSSDGTNTGMFLNSSGLSVTNLLDLSAATAGQIKFPATQNASADANTLDDYEEGTWTPSIGGSATYSNQSGNYIKVGGQVTVTGYLNIASIGSGSTGVISGNPFVAASNSPGSIGYFGNPVTNSIWQTVSADAGGTTFSVFWLAAAGSAPNNASGWFKTGTLTYFSCTYLT